MKQLSILVYLVIAAIITFTFYTKNESFKNNRTITYSTTLNSPGQSANLNSKVAVIDSKSQNNGSSIEFEKVYSSKFPKEGKIGYLDSSKIDNPLDNEFHIQINQEISPNTLAFLEYELYGVEDYNSVCKGINDQISIGGIFVKISNVWSKQSEAISADYLRKGDNLIRFSIPVNCEFGYKVKNVKLRLVPSNKSERRLVVNQPTTHYYFKKYGYINGFVTGNGSEGVKFYSNGSLIRSHKSSFEGCINKTQDSLESWQSVISAVFQDGQILTTTLFFDRSSLWDYSVNYQPKVPYSEVVVNKNKEVELKLDGFSLQVGKASLKTNSILSVTGLRSEDMALMGSSMINVTGVNKGFRCLPHGSQFEKEIRIHLAYDTACIPKGYSAKDIRTYYYDESSSRWIMLPLDTVDIAKNEVVSYTNHFTDFVNAILKTPESPQTQAFTPTSMKDIKFADPLAGFNPIAPPSANNSGTANLSYPIEIPAGRQGMQPQLAITYNSEGGNGWLGVGWDLNIPCITVETRWGVPLYDPALETESYLLNGEQLLPMVHRSAFVNRNPNVEKVFTPRVEGAFNKIIRHGNSPVNYWWEIIDKQGVKYYYGKYSTETMSNSNSVLCSGSIGNTNIAKWMLSEVRDLNGNYIKYNYDIITYTSNNYGTGKQICLSNITYTGFGNSDGRYKIDFKSLTDREDAQISARFGFVEVANQKLDEVDITFDSEFVRSYFLKYELGMASKELLCSIIEVTNENSISIINELTCEGLQNHPKDQNPNIKIHRFEYFNESTFGFGEENILVDYENDNDIDWDLLEQINITKESTLSRSRTMGFSVGGGVFIGKGPLVHKKTNSLGGSFNYFHDWARTLSTFMDIDGDGIPDKVIRKNGNEIYYRKLILNNGTIVYDQDLRKVEGLNKIGRELNKGKIFGLEAHIGLNEPMGCNATFGRLIGKTIIPDYFADINGDGLVDFVDNQKTYFNTLINGLPTFVNTENNQIVDPQNPCNYILYTGEINNSMKIEPDREDNDHYYHDAVRVWIAPFSGTVEINAPLKLIEDNSNYRQKSKLADGIMFTIQHNENEFKRDTINESNYNYKSNSILTRSVIKGDKIYFRLMSIKNENWDNVIWNPIITYVDPSINQTELDADNKNVYKFEAANDLLINNNSKFLAPVKGHITISGTFYSPEQSDFIYLQIYRGSDLIEDVSFQDNTIINHTINTSLEVLENDEISIKAFTNTNIDFSSVVYNLEIKYDDCEPSENINIDNNSNYSKIIVHPCVQYNLFQNTLLPAKSYYLQPGTYFIHPTIDFANNQVVNGSLILSVKATKKLIFKKNLFINNNILVTPDFSITLSEASTIYFDYYSENIDWDGKIINSKVIIDNSLTCSASFSIPIDQSELIFGNLYRGWGQFAYTSLYNNTNEIDEDLLYVKTNPNIDAIEASELGKIVTYEGMEDFMDNLQLSDPRRDPFGVMYPDLINNCYRDYSDNIRISKDEMSNSQKKPNGNTLENDMDDWDDGFDLQGISTQKLLAPRKIYNNISNSYSYSIGSTKFKPSSSFTEGRSDLEMDFFDLNGDNYPDIINAIKYQVTNPQGGLSNSFKSHLDENYPNINGIQSEFNAVGCNPGTTFNKIGSVQTSLSKAACNAVLTTGISGGFGDNNISFKFLDINGDGLPDKVTNDGKVSINQGYSFLKFEQWNFTDLQSGISINQFNTSYPFDLSEGSWAGGVSLSNSTNKSKSFMIDMNADGLVDLVTIDQSDEIKIKINKGVEFNNNLEVLEFGNGKINKSKTFATSANLASSFGFLFFAGSIFKVGFNPEISASMSWNIDKSYIVDVNNDDYPDFVQADGENIKVHYSTLGKINLLKSVYSPTGSAYFINYDLSSCDQKNPNRRWLLSSLKVYDGHSSDGEDTVFKRYEYTNGKYDRFERAFYGFETVTTKECSNFTPDGICYRMTIETFHINDMLFKGLKKHEVMMSGAQNKYVESYYTYKKHEISSGEAIEPGDESCYGPYFPAITQEDKYYYEGASIAQIHTRKRYVYGEYGNLNTYYNDGDVNYTTDDLIGEITYNTNKLSLNLLALVSHITVKDAMGQELRNRSASYTNSGQISELRTSDGNNHLLTNIEYDNFGNVVKILYPKNKNCQRISNAYTYDETVNTYPIEVKDSLGYSSQAEYDLRLGLPLRIFDITGNEMRYTYYSDGKPKTIIGPKEIANNSEYTIKFEYWDENAHDENSLDSVKWARTLHFDQLNSGNNFISLTFSDGLGRIVQSKQKATILGVDSFIVSGKVKYDEYGRGFSIGLPFGEKINYNSNNEFYYDYSLNPINPALNTYDILDRPLIQLAPDLTFTLYNYGFGTDAFGKIQFKTSITDPKGNPSSYFVDVRGLQTSVLDPLNNSTKFIYNPLGELLSSFDPEENQTTYAYDKFGRMTQRLHPDAGMTQYDYDGASNLISISTQNLSQINRKIEYTYYYNQLKSIVYPQNPENNVYYQYALPNNGNQTGKLVKMQDASGVQTFTYGNMGELIENNHTFANIGNSSNTYTFKMKWEYDSWNRIMSIQYPDNEKVTYTYDNGGQLITMSGLKGNDNYSYISSIKNDRYGHRRSIYYGNETHTDYTYNLLNGHLINLKSYNGNNELMQNLAYTYDNASNITNVTNSASYVNTQFGGSYSYTYSYDNLNRLTNSTGSFSPYQTSSKTYNLALSYSASGNILTKNLNAFTLIGGTVTNKVYNNTYEYEGSKPHALSSAGNQIYEWDGNGNLLSQTNNSQLKRNLCWDEENRLAAVSDFNEDLPISASAYLYNAGGERTWKISGSVEQMTINGQFQSNSVNINQKTLYTSSFMVANDQNYTKHYYIEGERVCTKIGGGFAGDLPDEIAGPAKRVVIMGCEESEYNCNWSEKSDSLKDMILRNFVCSGIEPLNVNFEDELNGIDYSYDLNSVENDRYFYHSDHLGSSSFITDASGNATQHLQYLPFGETFIDQRTNSFSSRYTFSAKEKDDETGYSYFGARYYDSELSVWLSVDPIINPSESPYSYCSLRPIVLIDPTGMSPEEIGGGGGNKRIPTKKTDKPKPPKQRGNSPNHKFNNFLRKIGLGKRIATVPMGENQTSDWTVVGHGNKGRSVFHYKPDNYSDYRLRGVRIEGNGSGILGTLITTGTNLENGAFGKPIDGLYALWNKNGFEAGFFPGLNQAIYMSGLWFAMIPNMFRLNPMFNKATHFAVYRGGNSDDYSYNLNIRFRNKVPYLPGTNERNFFQKWFYGTSF